MEKVSRGAAFGDYDNDGDIDILILNIDDTPTLLRNDGGNRNHWLQVSLIGTASNRDGIGVRIEAVVAGRVQIRQIVAGTSFLSHSDIRAHFGLQRATKVERLVVRWPGGRVEEFRDLDADQWLVITEGQGDCGAPDAGQCCRVVTMYASNYKILLLALIAWGCEPETAVDRPGAGGRTTRWGRDGLCLD